MQISQNEVKMYSDYKSPYAFLAFDPAFDIQEKFAVSIRWIPFQLRLKGKGERSAYSEFKVRYSYMDARRWANKRGGIVLKGPLKIYDTRPALIGGLFMQEKGLLQQYSQLVYRSFFRREFEVDDIESVVALIVELGLDAEEFRDFHADRGQRMYDACQDEAMQDHVFGVPMFIFNGEQFWGHDRLELLQERLVEAGLNRSVPSNPIVQS